MPDPRRGELKGKRETVEPPTQFGEWLPVGRPQLKAGLGGVSACYEELRSVCFAEGLHGPALLALNTKRFPARDQHPAPAHPRGDGVDQLGHCVEHMLAVVENHQQIPDAQRANDPRDHRVLLADGNPKGNGHSPRHAARIANCGEVDERASVEPICDSVCDFERQPGLADAAHAHESH